MKSWHCLVLLLVAYAIGALYPGPFQSIRSTVGL